MSLKQQATKGIFWSAIERFSAQAINLTIGVILARLLLPEDFGLVGMLAIFIAVSNTFIGSGMASGLIQKTDRTDKDYSTVFIFNLAVSLIAYAALFILAPFVANFYEQPLLTNLMRVLSLNLIIGSLAIVQRTRLTITLDFKTLAKVNLLASFVAGVSAIIAAYYGASYWALVIQSLVSVTMGVLLLWTINRWKPSMVFSKDSFDELFGFGSKLLIAGIYAQIFRNIYSVIIGKYYTVAQLGFYDRAVSFTEISAGTITSVLEKVTYPILTTIKEDQGRMVAAFSRMIRMASFVMFPFMTLIALLAKPIILLLLTAKWTGVIVLLQWMVFARVFYPVSAINMNILNVIGRSDLFLKVDLVKSPILILALIVTIPLGIKAIVIGHVVTSFLAYLINAYLPGKMFGYGGLAQLKDMLPYMFSSIVMAIVVYLIIFLFDNMLIQLIVGTIAAATSYLLSCYLLGVKEVDELSAVLKIWTK